MTYADDDVITTRAEALAYLTKDGGHLLTPCCRYGRDADECAPVAWKVARLVAACTDGEPITVADLDHVMGLVVNDHDDVAYMINAYGHGNYGR